MHRIRIATLGALSVSAHLLFAATGPAGAQVSPEEQARLSLLDKCVYIEYARRGKGDGLVGRCKCIAKGTAANLSPRQQAAFVRNGRLTRQVKDAWVKAAGTCG